MAPVAVAQIKHVAVARGDRIDATDPSVASGAISTLNTVAAAALNREAGTTVVGPVAAPDIIVHRRYNPEGITQYNIVPGLLGVILQLTMVMMTAMALTREIERGTMENLLSMPASPLEIMLGKVVPYLGFGAVQVAVVLVAAKAVFGIPFRGMPLWAQYLGELMPLTHFLRLIRSVMLKGAGMQTVAGSFLVLAAFVLALALVSLLRFRRTLD
ncbi:ABC transporter permease [Seohaeicola nanhaiensis]|uniref:ABC transporter permease n=1 Tax=Seohaeicola nanhaiensis TaxID=1387282 RepID=A0ABV9KB49_9RHOB